MTETIDALSYDEAQAHALDMAAAQLVVDEFIPDDPATHVAFAGCINAGLTIEEIAEAIEQPADLVASIILNAPRLIAKELRSRTVSRCLVLLRPVTEPTPEAEPAELSGAA